jgi:pyruvate,water dikinase
MKPYILPFSDSQATLETVGGKGMSLAKMINAEFPVPDGFHVTTEAYRQFIAANNLQSKILDALKDVDAALPASLETVSASISRLFTDAVIPDEIANSITEAYVSLPHPNPAPPGSGTQGEGISVAVRSSATTEDLPKASFAGQQESFLNIHGEDALLDSVKRCWASLWTARAIAYRINNNIDQYTVALAVVVQEMVNAEASGVLFTVNPINGRRDEMVINAAWGLGVAVVGGLVTPDTIVADKATGRVKSIEVAEKTVVSVAAEKGTREAPLNDARRMSQVLVEADISSLVSLARRVETFFERPQDIEWCRKDGRFYILQSRPITALPPQELSRPREWKLPAGSYAAMRNNIVELMANPLSPLFATLGLSAVNASLHRLLGSFAMGGIMPEEIIVTVNSYAYMNGSVSVRSMLRMVFGARKIMRMMFTGALERWTGAGRPRYFQAVEAWNSKELRALASVELADGARRLTESAIDAYGALISGVIPAAWITEALFTQVYNRLVRRRADPSAPTYLLGYDSLPIRADQSLYRLAEWARKNPALAHHLQSVPTARLAAARDDDFAPPGVTLKVWQEWRSNLRLHLQEFGHMIYDLDFMHPVPADDPAPVYEALKLYLMGGGVNPVARQRALAERREQAAQVMIQRLTGFRKKWFTRYLASAQKYAPLREDGLAEIGLAYPLIRQMLRELGRRFAAQQVVPTADDIFWMTEDEVLMNAAQIDAGMIGEPVGETILQRKAKHRAAMQANPPMALPQIKLFGFDLMSLKGNRGRGEKGDVIKGVAASPGIATGAASVLHGPEDFSQMKPGNVLVAPITTPAWTPLFAIASAIVTDVGGPLSHGSIVAREYGIPAVLGTAVATRRIPAGQTITVDGSAGTVEFAAST